MPLQGIAKQYPFTNFQHKKSLKKTPEFARYGTWKVKKNSNKANRCIDNWVRQTRKMVLLYENQRAFGFLFILFLVRKCRSPERCKFTWRNYTLKDFATSFCLVMWDLIVENRDCEQRISTEEAYQISNISDAFSLGSHISNIFSFSKGFVDWCPSGSWCHSSNILYENQD